MSLDYIVPVCSIVSTMLLVVREICELYRLRKKRGK